MDRLPYRDVWGVDFEFHAPSGERPQPLCLVARELRSGALSRRWLADGAPAAPPYDTGPESLFIAYYSSVEWSCHLALDWPLPVRILDLYAEFRCLTCGLPTPCGSSLLGALAYFGLDGLGAAAKEGMRQLAMRGGPYSDAERLALLDYCQSDVDALARLLPAMLARLDLPRAVLRGRYMGAAARMEWNGVPLDVDTLTRLRDGWQRIKGRLIEEVDRESQIYVPAGRPDIDRTTKLGAAARRSVSGPMRFSVARFADYLARNGIPWKRLESGALALDANTFREMARAYPAELGPIRELRHALSQMRLHKLAVGSDGRNRLLLSAFRSRTGRNQPSNTEFIFGPSTWLRSLIRPGPGRALAYVDWSAQELGIAAALSGDQAMQDAYRSGDPYLWLAWRVKAVPPDATKKSHPVAREQFKVVSLGVLYGLSAEGLARRLIVPPCRGHELLQYHQETFRQFWRWSDAVLNYAMMHNFLETAFGWRVHVGPDANPRSLRNFPMQANGAEMLRLACCLATERGIAVCCPVHDALLVEGPADGIEAVVRETQEAMREASELVLPGFPLRTDAKIVRHSDRYVDDRGRRMWDTVQRLLDAEATPIMGDTLPLSPAIPPPPLILFLSSNTCGPSDP
jgi:hypothetical protein